MLKEMVKKMVAMALYMIEFANEHNDLFEVLDLVPMQISEPLQRDYKNLVEGHDSFYQAEEDKNGIVYVLDLPKRELKPGVEQVYPHLEEGEDLVSLAQYARTLNRDKSFSLAKVAFCGKGTPSIGLVKPLIVEETLGGKQLKVLKEPIAAHAIGIDLNPRAVEFAKLNSYINGVHDRCRYLVSDIEGGFPKNGLHGQTIYVANAPFALEVEGVREDLCRAGGLDGLKHTMEFLRQVKNEAKSGDFVVLVAYSRMAAVGRIELLEKLKELWGEKIEIFSNPMSHRKLCRGWNGRKEQENPMPIEDMVVRAHPDDHQKRERLEAGIAAHLEQGWTHLGYIGLIINVK